MPATNLYSAAVPSRPFTVKQILLPVMPAAPVFTASSLNTDTGKGGVPYSSYGGVALECQFYPNGINYGDKYILPILKKGTRMCHYMRYELEGVE